MVQPVPISEAAIGACLSCRQLFLVTPESPNCLLCGRPPAYTLAFDAAHPEPVEGPEPAVEEAPPWAPSSEEPAPGSEQVPPVAAAIVPEEAEEEEIDNLEVLLEGTKAYLSDAGITSDDVDTWLRRMGADPASAASAVSHLAAVRELLQQLQQPSEPAPVELE